MTLREEVLKNSGVLEEGALDGLKTIKHDIKARINAKKADKLEAQVKNLEQQAKTERDFKKREELKQQIANLHKQIRLLRYGQLPEEPEKPADKQEFKTGYTLAAKKHNGICPDCGKKFDECECC